MQAKKDQHLLESAIYQDRALQYFEKSSTLVKQKFWLSLSQDARKRAAKYFVLQEIQDSCNIRMGANKDTASIYVVLNGSATVMMSDSSEEAVYNTGDIFGTLDVFNELSENPNADIDLLTTQGATKQRMMTASLRKGSYLRISLVNFYKYVLAVDRKEPDENRIEYSRISGLPWDEITDEDKRHIEIYLRAKKVLRKNLFDFLSSYHMIPYNSRAAVAKAYKERHFGYHIDLNSFDVPSVFIFLDGEVRVELVTRRNKEASSHLITCARKGKRPMVVKVSL
jgi:hypothetical protein